MVEKKIPKESTIKTTTDYKGNYIYGVKQGNGDFYTFVAVNKLTGIMKEFNPWIEPGKGFFKATINQNS